MVPAAISPEFKSLDTAVISLDDVEARLVKFLLYLSKYIQQKSPQETSLELRFTGGWVRDKLLGVASHDIDVAINTMTGYQFGLLMNEYLDVPGNAEEHGLGGVNKKAGSLAKIAANPEKSKHLETVTTRIFGLDLDLVNLRKETYSEDSRNPQMDFGTPEEDAMRRDATINAMFYNITTGKVEDFTGRGFDDLQNQIIRTPLDPYTTFKDDPLRVLRLIRFASRFGYTIDLDTKKYMGDERIKDALKQKITKERVYIEVEKMLKGPDPHRALELIDERGLYHTIFVEPVGETVHDPNIDDWPAVYNALKSLLEDETEPRSSLRSILVQNEDEKFLSWTLATMVPWADAPELPPKKGRPQPPMATVVAIAALKAPNKITDLLTLSVRNLKEIRKLKDKGEQSREVLGMAIRRWGASWRQQVMFALLYEIFASPSSEKSMSIAMPSRSMQSLTTLDILQSYSSFLDTISDQGLSTVYDLKPLIDGTKLAKALDTLPGPWMRSALDVVMAWQLRNPSITDPADAVEEVKISGVVSDPALPVAKKQKTGELKSDLIAHFLRLTLRPLFAQAPRNPEITAQGRMKMGDGLSKRFGSEGIVDEESKLWKKEKWALPLLRWVCASLDAEVVEREWGSLIPPILTVVDDTDVKARAKGAELLRLLLVATPPILLRRTGLAPLFEESLYVSATYLPTLTPEEDSITILNATLPALLVLANAAHPAPPSPPGDAVAHSTRIASLDKILRKAVLLPHNHANEHVRITKTLLSHLPAIVHSMGIDSVKHLKDLVPLLSHVLSEPLGPAYPPLLLAAARGMDAVILNGWPRIGRWRAEILRGVSVAWIRLAEEGEAEEGFEDVRHSLRNVVGTLKEAVTIDAQVDWGGDTSVLVGADERLAELFKV
jgi:tRNA nucleotidyltransferase (CCA-adding enzyme)